MSEEKKALLKEAYQFGYFIGLRGHSEWAEWVRKKREELYRKAEELGIYDLVKDAYHRGKELGKRDREEQLYEGLAVKAEKDSTPRPNHIVLTEPEQPLKESSELEREYVEFLNTTKLTMPPELLDSLKHLGPPKMLRLGD